MARVRWWHSAIFAAIVAAYLIYGLAGGGDMRPARQINDFYNTGGLVVCSASLAFIVIYTLLGLRKDHAGWWTNTTGYCLMVLAGAVFCRSAVLSWAVIFNHGLIDTPRSAWLFVGATWLIGLAMVSLCLLWWWNRDAVSGEPAAGDPFHASS